MAQAATCACCSSRLRSPICSRPLTRNPHGANRSGLTAWISRDPPYPESRANSAATSVIVGSAVTGKWLKKTESRTAFASVIWAIINPQASMALAVLASVLVQRATDTVAGYNKCSLLVVLQFIPRGVRWPTILECATDGHGWTRKGNGVALHAFVE